MPFTPRQRVQLALAHIQPDRPPFSWGLRLTPEMASALDAYLHSQDLSWRGLSLATEETIPISPRYIGPPLPPHTDIWGIVRRSVSYGAGAYDEIEHYPLASADSPADITAYPWPDPAWFDYTGLPRQLHAADPHARLAGKLWIDVCGNPLEIYTWMTGHERTFTNLVLNPELVHAALDHITSFFEAKLRLAFPLVAKRVDICYFADDLGGQHGLLLSPDAYRQVIMPYHQRLFRLAKELALQAGIEPPAIMLHTDGSVFDLLPDLLGAGVEVLEAVQVDAARMEPDLLKYTFGASLAFHGAVSVQSLLPHQTKDAVESACRDLVDVLGENGGYIAAPTHCVQVGTPPENVLAMLRGILGVQDYASAMQAARLEPFRLELDSATPNKAATAFQALQFPVKNGAGRVVFSLESAGNLFYEFDVELAIGEAPDWWACLPLQPLLELPGLQDHTKVTLCSSAVPLAAFEWLRYTILQGNDLLWADDLYREPLRPQLHFTPRRGWNNDPNGLLFFNDTWHLFFQHNPFGTAWGNMHWGHAVSSDLFHWREQPIALFQHSLVDMAFSGGGCVDISNTSALARPGEVPMLLFYTSTGRGECLAYSLDDGTSFREYAANPLITHRGRDPKVIWYSNPQDPSTGHWVMIVYEELDPPSELPADRGYAIYTSQDLKSWRRTDFLPGFFECPELFQLPVEGESGSTYWVIHGALWKGDPPPDLNSVFLLGDFDGCCFTPLSDPLPAHYGPHFYASQVFSVVQSERFELGRSVMLGWLMGAAYPGMPFSQGLTLPLELSLRRVGGGISSSSGLRLCFNPVLELDSLRTATDSWQDLVLSKVEHTLNALPDELLDLHLSLALIGGAPFEFHLGDQLFSYDPATGEASFAGRVARLAGVLEPIQLRLVVDRSVVEIFVQNGEVAFASMVLFNPSVPRFALCGSAHIRSLTVHTLKSVWED